MSNNGHWHNGHYYPPNNAARYPQQPQQHAPMPDAMQHGQRLLAAYPPASATPTNHVARHMGGMTLAPLPTFRPQPAYPPMDPMYPPRHPPTYTDYDARAHYLAGPHAIPNNSTFWQHSQDAAVRTIHEQAGPSYRFQEPVQWATPQPVTSYHTPSFAQSVYQRIIPNNTYSNPPPPLPSGSSSSSLANALVPPKPPPPRVYHPQESPAFFDKFLDTTVRHIEPHSRMPSPVKHSTATRVQPAPPRPATPLQKVPPKPADPAPVTPLKRKPAIEIVRTSPLKRLNTAKSLSSSFSSEQVSRPQLSQSSAASKTPTTNISLTPSSTTSSFSRYSTTETPTHKRPVNLAYVEVPPSPYSTPFSPRKGILTKNLDTPSDLGGYGPESSPTKRRDITDSVKTSARRTGDRDERGPLEKLTSLIEDIFEAEDGISPDTDVSELNHDFFSTLSIEASRPRLCSSMIRKLIKYIGQVARPAKRQRQTTGTVLGTPRHKERMSDVDPQVLSRLMKILERSVQAGEDIDVFPHQPAVQSKSVSASPKKPSAKKSAKGKKTDQRSKSQSPQEEKEQPDAVDGEPASKLGAIELETLARSLDMARDSILAADCCIAILSSDRLTKQLYSEELITSCLSAVKNQLTKILYPFVEASSDFATGVHPLLQTIVKNSSPQTSNHRQKLSELFQSLSAAIPRISELVNAETVAMSDTIIIQAVYISIGPFFVADGGGDGDGKGKKENVVIKTLGKSAMRGLRLDSLSLIRSIFAHHEDQRSWIIEEILSSLIKLSDSKQKAGQFRLRDGRSIRTVSALLMQLVQTSAHDVRIEARKIQKKRQANFALKRQESFSESHPSQAQPFLDEMDHDEIRLYGSALESATKAAKSIIIFLTQRSGKHKATKNSNEAEYRAIFDNLIDDLLTVLFWPEWPAAALILSIASKFMVASLDDIKTNSQTDSNAAKTMALDHLGVIAARIRTSILKVQKQGQELSTKGLKPLEEILTQTSLKALNRYLDAHEDIVSHLCKRSSEDQAYDSARELAAATLGHELASVLQQVNTRLESGDIDDDLRSKTHTFGQRLKGALREVWKDPSTDVFDIGSQDEVAEIDGVAEEFGTLQSLRNSFNPILATILMALDAPAIFMRTKALRALGQIVTSDSTILSMPNVRRGIESHLLDNSSAVRDAAVELIGKYMIESPAVAGEYYQKIADRMADTGLSVRKRVIKLLKQFYGVTEDNARKVDISTRLILRNSDEDDTVKDLATKTIEEIWFPPTSLPSAMKSRGSTMTTSSDKTALLSKVVVIMGTAANFKDRQSPLEDILHKIMVDKEGQEAMSLHVRYGEICEALIDGLVDATDLPGFTVINCIRTIYLLTSAYPAVLTGPHASTLLPYLKNASTAEELATSDYLLKIFRVTIPRLPKTATKFGQELQAALQPMILKPSGTGGVQILQETVGCLCAVVQHLTHDYIRLINLIKSCNARLQQTIKRPTTQEIGPTESKALVILIFIVALLAENCNFDDLRRDQPALAKDIDAISQGPITEHIYNTMLTLYDKHTQTMLRGRVLQCLGFLFRAQPTLMTEDRSAVVMDEIFASPEEEGKGRLLKIIQDFLVSEAAKHHNKEKEVTKSKGKQADVNMDELIGNTDGFADSGVSSAIVQRYLDHVLEAALSPNTQIQAVAIDVLSFTVKQGLAHPLQSFPVIVALETSPIASVYNRATALHTILQGKHSSLLNTRYTISARASFDYQKKVAATSGGVVKGFRVVQGSHVAMLQRWYSHVREKRTARQDFLRSLVKVFRESDTTLEATTQDDVDYTRYMAENFAALEYKTMEEVLTVIKFLTNVLSTSGMQIVEVMAPGGLLSLLHDDGQKVSAIGEQGMEVDVEPQATKPAEPALQHNVGFMRTSVLIAMVMLLKAHLKGLYSLSEEKCLKFVVGKKSAVGDKPATRKHDSPISWDRLKFATTPLLTSEDTREQKETFLAIWNEDGVSGEPEDDDIVM